MDKGLVVGVIGGTGAVGRAMLEVLEATNFPVSILKVFASEKSKGSKIIFKGKEIIVEELRVGFEDGLDIAFFATSKDISAQFVPIAAEKGVWCIDNSSFFRLEDRVPLIVPEINSDTISPKQKIIANPNCSTTQMCVALAPLKRHFGIKRVIVSTYQSASGAGSDGIDELLDQVKAYAKGEAIKCSKFSSQLLFNLIPHIDIFTDNGYTKEEMKMVLETQKIFKDQNIKVSATCVRVPVLRAHSEAITVELASSYESIDEIREILTKGEGVEVIDNLSEISYPMPLYAANHYPTYIGRIRRDLTFDNGVAMWVVADQLLKGAALNAVQIGHKLIELGYL